MRVFAEFEQLSQNAAAYIARLGKRCAAEQGKFELVLSGGKTPLRTYEMLAEMTSSERGLWDKTKAFWGTSAVWRKITGRAII